MTLYGQAIINYRMSLRRNNFDSGMSAIHKLSSLFHALNHPYYQLIELYMSVQALMQPAEVYKLAKDNYTITLLPR